MFYFSLLLGGGLILLGLQKRKAERNPDQTQSKEMSMDKQDKLVDSSGFYELNDRIDQLQKLVFESLMAKEENRLSEKTEIFEEKASGIEDEIAKPEHDDKPLDIVSNKEVEAPETMMMPENIKAILEYENQGLSIQEIAKQTHMNKGEVLLLQNLAKHYAK